MSDQPTTGDEKEKLMHCPECGARMQRCNGGGWVCKEGHDIAGTFVYTDDEGNVAGPKRKPTPPPHSRCEQLEKAVRVMRTQCENVREEIVSRLVSGKDKAVLASDFLMFVTAAEGMLDRALATPPAGCAAPPQTIGDSEPELAPGGVSDSESVRGFGPLDRASEGTAPATPPATAGSSNAASWNEAMGELEANHKLGAEKAERIHTLLGEYAAKAQLLDRYYGRGAERTRDELADIESKIISAVEAPPCPRCEQIEMALKTIAYMSGDCPAPADPELFYRHQFYTAVGIAARALALATPPATAGDSVSPYTGTKQAWGEYSFPDPSTPPATAGDLSATLDTGSNVMDVPLASATKAVGEAAQPAPVIALAADGLPLPDGLDRGIRRFVEVLNAGGIETYESCQGGEGHAYPEPTVRFHGNHRSAGFRALAVALDHALPVAAIRLIWTVTDGQPTGPKWEMTFSRLSEERHEDAL